MTNHDAVAQLRQLIGALVSARVKNRDGWRRWRQNPANEQLMAECLGYNRLAGMPSVTSLVKPFFHPTLPLIGLNYTQVAHVTLHQFHNGWTVPMRLCRGIVFDRRGKLVAFPFPKFFNYGEHAETQELPNEPFTATAKEDGHLGIIFEYKGEIIATTRGSFESSSSAIANQMLSRLGASWAKSFPKNITLLAEVIHPATKVIVEYNGQEGFIVIGAFDRTTLHDLDHKELAVLATRLALPLADLWHGYSMAELKQLVKHDRFLNKEGFVARFASGLRVKFKFAGYIGRMIGDKLTHKYVMLRLIDGSFEKKFSDLPGEVQQEAKRLAGEILAVTKMPGDKKAHRLYLHGLVPVEEQTTYYKSMCGRFYSGLIESGQLKLVPAA